MLNPVMFVITYEPLEGESRGHVFLLTETINGQ